MRDILFITFAGFWAYKSGILLLFFRETINGPYAATDALMTLFLPIPLTSLALTLWPAKKPGRHILPSLIVMSASIALHGLFGMGALLVLVAAGVWFGVALKGFVAHQNKEWIRPLTSAAITAVIIGDASGFILWRYGFNSAYLQVVLLLMASLLSSKFINNDDPSPDSEELIFDWKVFLSYKSLSIVTIFILLGGSEPIIVSRLNQLEQTETYGLFLSVRSIITVLLLQPAFLYGLWNIWLFVTLASFFMLILGPMWFVLPGYAVLGAGSAVMLREYDTHYLTSSNYPQKTSAAVYLILSSIMTLAVVAGGMI